MIEETKRALLSQAAAHFGVMPLAKRLRVPDTLVAAWLSGHTSMPDCKILPLIGMLGVQAFVRQRSARRMQEET